MPTWESRGLPTRSRFRWINIYSAKKFITLAHIQAAISVLLDLNGAFDLVDPPISWRCPSLKGVPPEFTTWISVSQGFAVPTMQFRWLSKLFHRHVRVVVSILVRKQLSTLECVGDIMPLNDTQLSCEGFWIVWTVEQLSFGCVLRLRIVKCDWNDSKLNLVSAGNGWAK